MLKKILLDQERILVHDQLSYMTGPLQITSEVILTNHRILVLPHSQWSQSLGYQRKNVIWDDVKDVTLSKLNKNLQIETTLQTLSLWGGGARRLFEWIEKWRSSKLSLETSWPSLEKRQAILCDDILVSVGIGLASLGDLNITRRGFTLRYQGLETHHKDFRWSDLKDINYSSITQKLKFTSQGSKFTLQGNQAQLLHHLLNIFQKNDVFVDCLWEGDWTGQQSNSGFIMLGQQALYLLPCNKQSSLTDKPYIRIPCSKIQYLEHTDDNSIKLFTSKGQVWTLSISMPNLWMGYMTRMLLHFWNAQNTMDDTVACARVHNQKEAITFGHMTLNENTISFKPNGLRPIQEIDVFEVIKMNRRSSRLTIQYEVYPEAFEFLDEAQVAQMADLIEPKLSPMSVSFIGKAEPTDSIIGKTKRLAIYMDGSLLVTINNSTISEKNGTIKIRCSRFTEKVFIPNNIQVEIDVISRRGHYVFFAQVLENHLNTPDIDGQYNILIQQIGYVRLINQRAAFRVPTEEQILFTLKNCNAELEDTTAKMVDLSAGGCQLELRQDIEEDDLAALKKPQTVIEVHILLDKTERRSRGKFAQLTKKKKKVEHVIYPAKVRRLFQPEDTNKTIIGLEFLENTPSNEHRLMKKILHLERSLIQRHRRIILKGEN